MKITSQENYLPTVRKLLLKLLNATGLAPTNFTLFLTPNIIKPSNYITHQAKIDQHDSYVERVVKLEFGAKSAPYPNTKCTISPYIDDDITRLDFGVKNITTIIPERTLWDKIIILHSIKGWFDNQNELKGGGHRESRHYYDVFQVLQSEIGRNALNDIDLGSECVLQSRVFFYRKQFNLEMAKPPTFSILPEGRMLRELRNDYEAMSGMIFGNPPRFEDIIDCVRDLEMELNAK
ncbi:MAG: nucleotidyl transferase AbiEii/AbiGii toxin family protein [Rhodobacteraceae bacterium]|nr:nucleotidyl transferase AbiEii/AbiGii toxin family protein [Paracoccaceae bacterium]MCY4308594.1 nucleotidyl transferase AbiEii/AbiGii toxin family protein [Paracoccaceae bacterium]